MKFIERISICLIHVSSTLLFSSLLFTLQFPASFRGGARMARNSPKLQVRDVERTIEFECGIIEFVGGFLTNQLR
ncbi:hypothetical protein VNO77_24906 [Canavalia gladiata]|uniref:Uncharacterized protein n=1 Tax=Canavalia gladiata TaxID=3824 RepID=A0AAN9QGP5_CANGL